MWEVAEGKASVLLFTSWQARSQDLERGEGGLFERVRQLQATLTRIFIVRESDSNGLSKIETDFSAEIGNSNGSSGRITATPSQLRHQIPSGGGLFSFLEQKSASKALKTCDFAYFSGQWGGGSSPPSRPSYATASWYR